ncbi:MAG: asparagine synthase C-terminal domain-containing protein [Candidatus Odinarchaeota archaeon]
MIVHPASAVTQMPSCHRVSDQWIFSLSMQINLSMHSGLGIKTWAIMTNETLTDYTQQLKTMLTDTISSSLKSQDDFGVLFSGGLDSSIIAAILASLYSEAFPLFVTGITSAKDIPQARLSASHLNLPLTIRIFTHDDVKEKLSQILSICGVVDLLHAELAISFFFATECARQNNVTTVFSGQGADELFGGYARHERCFIESGSEKASVEMLSDLKKLQEVSLPCLQAVVNHFGLQLVTPFSDTSLIEYSRNLPFWCKLNLSSGEVVRKQLLRQLAQELGFPSQVVNAPKRAVQYGSGVHRILIDLATEYWSEKEPTLSARKARSHTRINQFLAQINDE